MDKWNALSLLPRIYDNLRLISFALVNWSIDILGNRNFQKFSGYSIYVCLLIFD